SSSLLPELKRGSERIRGARLAKLKWPRKQRPIEIAEPAPSQPVADQQPQSSQPAEKKQGGAPAAILEALRQAREQAKERTKS
ncbi:MAG: hypothetical protein J2P21_17305, partial [Chloracidobacterium sp.]|nr:hypothetical protein [Chloracidobacterium sp.]